MPERSTEQIRESLDSLYRVDSGRILATLIRLLGDFDLAEESMHEAFAAALESWPQTGIPDKPRPWLISTARFKAIDGMRRRARFDGAQSAETKEQLGGIGVLEARDMNHAVQLMAQPPALEYGRVFEIRPAADLSEMMKASEQRRRKDASR